MRKSVAFLVMIMALALLSSCGQMEVQQPEEPHQEVIPDAESVSEATVVPIITPEPEPPETEIISLPQPQADGTGISFEIPEDWNQYPTDAIQNLQVLVDDTGNMVLYGVLRGFMDSQEVSTISLLTTK